MKRISITMTVVVGLIAGTGSALAFQPISPQCPYNGVCNGIGPAIAPSFQRGVRMMQGTIQPTVSVPLSDQETTQLVSMREEEKLARDVYLALYKKWDDQIFLISNAEQRHMNALETLILRYDVDDPVVDDTPGEFTNPVFTQLYQDLVATGSESLVQAISVGVLIEELDIVDLKKAMKSATHQDLLNVYSNLMRGSRNHLRAFTSRLPATEPAYEPQYLSLNDFDAIAKSPIEPGLGWQAVSRNGTSQGRGRVMGRGFGQGFRQNTGFGPASLTCPMQGPCAYYNANGNNLPMRPGLGYWNRGGRRGRGLNRR